MELAYQDELVTLYRGDCIDGLLRLGVAADLVLTDPPYGETSLRWDRAVKGWPDLAFGNARPTSSLWVFGSLKSLALSWSEFAPWSFAEDIVWEKHNGSGSSADRFRRVHEHALHFYRGAWADVFKQIPRTRDVEMKGASVKRREAGQHLGTFGESSYVRQETRLQRSVVKARSCHGQAQHPTQKPVELVRMLIESSCPPGGLVLDPFAGSGTTLVAAKECGRRAIGIEIDAGYCEVAIGRLAQESMRFAT